MIEVRDVTAQIDAASILTDVSFTADRGEHIALVGPNGAGKTTLLRVLAGLQPAVSGDVRFAEMSLSEMPAIQRARRMSYLPQSREVAWDLAASDVAALGRFAWGARRYDELSGAAKQAVDTALEKTGASAFLARSIRTLSGGEQARVHLARVLAAGSDVLMLDEPCAALDIRHQLELMHVLETERAAGRAIITVLHDLDLAERFATRLIVLSEGRVHADISASEGLPADILSCVFSLKRRAEGGFSRS